MIWLKDVEARRKAGRAKTVREILQVIVYAYSILMQGEQIPTSTGIIGSRCPLK